jgi:hypothetical protein
MRVFFVVIKANYLKSPKFTKLSKFGKLQVLSNKSSHIV